jgi:Ca2+-binding RTX toxin-like protein
MGVDYLYGGSHDDRLVGDKRAGSADHIGNNDYLYGSLGADRLIGQAGNDYLRCAVGECAGRPPTGRLHIAHSPRALGPGKVGRACGPQARGDVAAGRRRYMTSRQPSRPPLIPSRAHDGQCAMCGCAGRPVDGGPHIPHSAPRRAGPIAAELRGWWPTGTDYREAEWGGGRALTGEPLSIWGFGSHESCYRHSW